MDAVIFKSYLINKLTYWFSPIIVIVLAVIYLKLNLTDENRTMVCGASIGIGFIVIFYLSRNEPGVIKFDKTQIDISYVIKPPYGRKRVVYLKDELEIVRKSDQFILVKNARIVAKIRKKALNIKDWKILENYFGQ